MSAHQQPSTVASASGDENPDIEQIQASIAHTREDLGETVDALTAKLDVKSRTRARLTDAKARQAAAAHRVQEKATRLVRSVHHAATDDDGTPTPATTAATAALAAVLVTLIGVVVSTRRRHIMPVLGRRTRR